MKNNIFSSLKQYADLSKQIKEQRALVLRNQRLVRALGESFDSEVCASERAVADGEFLGHVSYAFNENLPCAFFTDGKQTCGQVACSFYVCNNEYLDALAKYRNLCAQKKNFWVNKKSRNK